MIRAALYIRVSTDEQALRGDSIETQKYELKEYALKNNYQIIDYYIDDGYTATNLKRPNLHRLLEDIKNDKIDMVLFTKIDRWSRGVRNYYKIQDVLDKHKTHWKTIFENYDTSTAAGRLHINIMLSVAENESAQTSERIKAVFKNKLAKGEVCSGKIPKGYKIENKKLVIDPETAPMVKDIFDYYERYNSVTRLVEYVKTNYYHIHHLTLRNLLSNPLYKGEHRCNSSVTKNYSEPIVSIEQWDNVQRLLSKNLRPPRKGLECNFIFSSLLKCKECGHSLTGNRQLKKNKKLGEYYYKTYRCQNHYKEKVCSNNYNIPEKNILEGYLLNNIKKELDLYITSIKTTEKINKAQKNSNVINNLERKLVRLKDLYIDELIDKKTYKDDYDKINMQLSELKNNEILSTSKCDIKALESFLKQDIQSIYDTLDTIEKRQLWISIIDYIEVGDNRNDIAIHFL